nr:MAG TPA: hypothetical protein [Caudoviricetes sp.]
MSPYLIYQYEHSYTKIDKISPLFDYLIAIQNWNR